MNRVFSTEALAIQAGQQLGRWTRGGRVELPCSITKSGALRSGRLAQTGNVGQ